MTESFRVVVPFTKKVPEVEKAVAVAAAQAGVRPEWVDVSGDDEAYHRLLKELWDGEQTFIVNEHDNVPHPWSYKEMAECNHAWCGTPYMVVGKIQTALGCTKFHRALLRDRPNVMDTGDRYWAHQDVVIGLMLLGTGIGQHVHMPPINHLNPKASLGRRRRKADVNVIEALSRVMRDDRVVLRQRLSRPQANRLAKIAYDYLRQDHTALRALVADAGIELEQIAGARFYPANQAPTPTEEVKVKVESPRDLGETEFVWMGNSEAWALGDEDLRPEERQ